MDRRADLQINQGIRRALVRHWIDLGRLVIRSAQGAVTIRGSLQRIAGQTELTAQDVGNIFDDIRRLSGVKRTNVDLSDWQCESGCWQSTDNARAASTPTRSSTSGPGKTYRLTKE